MFEEIINKAADIAYKNNKSADDYVKDGLIYCGKCNTPKEAFIAGFNKNMPVPCECRTRRIKEEKAKVEYNQRLEIINRNRNRYIPKEYHAKTFKNDKGLCADLINIAKNFVNDFKKYRAKGKGLTFYGGVGNGKTYASACIANALTDKGYKCAILSFPYILNRLKAERNPQEYIDELLSFDLLVIDDLGVERSTEFANEQIFNIINSFYINKKTCIFTTNLTSDELLNTSDLSKSRGYDRILEMTVPIQSKGESIRKRRAIEDYRQDIEKLKRKLPPA